MKEKPKRKQKLILLMLSGAKKKGGKVVRLRLWPLFLLDNSAEATLDFTKVTITAFDWPIRSKE